MVPALGIPIDLVAIRAATFHSKILVAPYRTTYIPSSSLGLLLLRAAHLGGGCEIEHFLTEPLGCDLAILLFDLDADCLAA